MDKEEWQDVLEDLDPDLDQCLIDDLVEAASLAEPTPKMES